MRRWEGPCDQEKHRRGVDRQATPWEDSWPERVDGTELATQNVKGRASSLCPVSVAPDDTVDPAGPGALGNGRVCQPVRNNREVFSWVRGGHHGCGEGDRTCWERRCHIERVCRVSDDGNVTTKETEAKLGI